MGRKIKEKGLLEMIYAMGSVGEPFGLFEPYIWRDKIGDGKWHCEIRSVDVIMASSSGMVLENVVRDVYEQMLSKLLKEKENER